ncbi:hypothetical protein A2U01_0117591, partial [Trifolium medium]|nr:hypothetical protein [Trifolium medium]
VVLQKGWVLQCDDGGALGAWVGLNLALEKGFKKVELRMDALGMVKAIDKEMAVPTEGWSLCKTIWRL